MRKRTLHVVAGISLALLMAVGVQSYAQYSASKQTVLAAPAQSTPAAVSNFTVTPADKGGMTVKLSWTNPTEGAPGEKLTRIDQVLVYRGDKLIKAFNDPAVGADMTYTDDLTEVGAGVYEYAVYATNEVGDGDMLSKEVFVGRDVPAAVTSLTMTTEGYDKVTLTWQQPELGKHGGYVDASSLSYKVVRQPDNKVVAENLKTTTIADADIKSVNKYSYTVLPMNADGEGPMVTTEKKILGPTLTMPATFSFAEEAAANSWTVVDTNNDGYTWKWNTTTNGGAMAHQPSNSSASDDWLISYYMPFKKGGVYRAELNLKAYGVDKLQFALLDKMNVEAPAQKLETADIKAATKKVGFIFTSEVDGFHNFAVQALSPLRADWLQVFDITVKEAEKVNMAAVSVTGPEKAMVGEKSVYTVRVENRGVEKQLGYRVTLADQDGNELVHKDVPVTLKTGESTDVELEWTPQTTATTAVRGEVSMPWAKDELADDDKTDFINVKVREPFNGKLVTLGDDTKSTSANSPFDLSNQYAAALNIYSADEVGITSDMALEKLAWFYDAPYQYNDVVGAPVRIYVANTDQTDTNHGWLDENEMTLVYDGTIDIKKQSSGELTIDLDRAFRVKAGENLAVLTVVCNKEYAPYVNFKQYKSPLEGNCAFVWGSYYEKKWFDFTQKGHKDYYGRVSSIMLYLTEKLENGINNAAAIANPAGAAYTICDIAGRLVATGHFNEQGTIDTSRLQRGVYVVTYTKDGKRGAMKISVNK